MGHHKNRRKSRKSGSTRRASESGASDDQIEQFLAQSDSEFLGGYAPSLTSANAVSMNAEPNISKYIHVPDLSKITPLSGLTDPSSADLNNKAVGAYFVLYVTRNCGICSYLSQSVMPALLDSYDAQNKSAGASGNTYPGIVKIAVETVVGDDLPDGVSSLPAFAVYYVDKNSAILRNKPIAVKEYKDIYAAATKDIKLLTYPLPSRLAYNIFYDWMPSIYDEYFYTDADLKTVLEYDYIKKLFTRPSWLSY